MRIDILPAPTPAFEDLVNTHTTFCDGTAPAESCHRLPVTALFTPDITVWAAHDGDALIGMGALKTLTPTKAEIKSMHTRTAARGKGTAKALLEAIETHARARGITSLWLETGVHPDFAAARALYAGLGFTECPPFGDYQPDPHSTFMTKSLEAAQ
ncbi:GNAT family N-acetyltransferase [Sagittula sp. SSi028]|uniref:GNAT family N-acetyltransferase n=1 Tax=Sagittula sp. SSi028 TaxID=3400636 RepID=UPI003AF9038D